MPPDGSRLSAALATGPSKKTPCCALRLNFWRRQRFQRVPVIGSSTMEVTIGSLVTKDRHAGRNGVNVEQARPT